MAGKPASKSSSDGSARKTAGKLKMKTKSSLKPRLSKVGKRAPPSDSDTSIKPKRTAKRIPGTGGWERFNVGDDFLMGLDEGGFMGLETLSAPEMISAGGGVSITPANASPYSEPAVTSPSEGVDLIQPEGQQAPGRSAGRGKNTGQTLVPPPVTALVSGTSTDTAAAAAGPPPSRAEKHEERKRKRAVIREAAAAAAATTTATATARSEANSTAPPTATAAPGGALDDPVAALKDHVARVAVLKRAAAEKKAEARAAAAAVRAAARPAELKVVIPDGASPALIKALTKKAKVAAKKDAVKAGREDKKDVKAAKLNQKKKRAEKRRLYKERKDAAAEAAGGEPSAKRAKIEGPQLSVTTAAALAALEGADMAAWGGHGLYPPLLAGLARQNFTTPTPIQEACLPPAIHGRRDIIGAAQTGSGKTLAFAIPILQALMHERATALREATSDEGIVADPSDGSSAEAMVKMTEPTVGLLRALILCPTRELAMQVCNHIGVLSKPCGVWAVPIVGGISALKQERLLSKAPSIVVATPGRLWDLIQNGEGHNAHLAKLSGLSFLVIDEADRMVQQGHFQEMANILDMIIAAKGRAPDPAAGADGDGGLAAQAAADADAEGSGSDAEGDEKEDSDGDESDDEGDEMDSGGEDAGDEMDEASGDDGDAEEGGSGGGARIVRSHSEMQTLVFSATLTLPMSLRRRLRKGGGGSSGSATLETLMDKVPFHGKPKIVDLTTETKIAERITEAQLQCGEAERDEALYYLLAAHKGRTIVFVNAISSLRRVAALLKHLGLPATPLHASMQQRQRLKALDRFRNEENAILVASDVAARGLDVKNVACVIHYQIPPSADVYVHRAGRTARAEAEGLSVALVTPKEAARYRALMGALGRPTPKDYPLDEGLMPACHQRVRLAVRLDEVTRSSSKAAAEKAWRRHHAEEMGIELSGSDADVDVPDQEEGPEPMNGEYVSAASQRRRARRSEKVRQQDVERVKHLTQAQLKEELAVLLAEPLRPRFSAKYFTGGASGAAVMMPTAAAGVDPTGFVAPGTGEGMQAMINMAQQLHTSRTAASAAMAEREAKAAHRVKNDAQKVRSAAAAAVAGSEAAGTAKGGVKVAKGGAGKGKGSAKQQQSAALAAALAAKQKQKQKKRGGMVVIPAALGRDTGAPDALQALRDRLAVQKRR